MADGSAPFRFLLERRPSTTSKSRLFDDLMHLECLADFGGISGVHAHLLFGELRGANATPNMAQNALALLGCVTSALNATFGLQSNGNVKH